MKRILLIEDNITIADGIKNAIVHENFNICICQTIKEAKTSISSNIYDLILLDIMLPDGNGLEFYQYIKSKYNVPIIFLTAKDSEDDIVQGLDIGADDYIVKPFRMRELISRIKSVLRRTELPCIIEISNIKFDEQNNIIYKNDNQVSLTALEYKIMTILIDNIGRLVTREYLLSRIWDISSNFVNDNTLTVYIKRLRNKIEDNPNQPKIIKTVKGIGYKIENDV